MGSGGWSAAFPTLHFLLCAEVGEQQTESANPTVFAHSFLLLILNGYDFINHLYLVLNVLQNNQWTAEGMSTLGRHTVTY